MESCTWSWWGDPQIFSVVIAVQPADRAECIPVPHVFRVEPRPDPLHELPAIVTKERGRRRESAENLRPAHGIDVRVVVAAHVHPELVVPPAPERDVLLRHHV